MDLAEVTRNGMQQAREYAKIVNDWRKSGIVELPTYPMKDTRKIIPISRKMKLRNC